ncbi:MAG TPA: DUF4129 domain-containing protein [Anaerolineae bacterium]|nr:DUF4129 domain-containing protein [Anaerolineae bacterium]
MSHLATNRDAQRGLRLSWRQELLRLAYAGMEISWFTQFFLVFVPSARLLPPFGTACAFGLIMLGVYAWSALAEAQQWSAGIERLMLLLALPILILLAWRVYLHSGLPLADLSWINAAGAGLLAAGSAGYWAVMVSVVFIWWRGLALGQRTYNFETVALAFRSGLLLLVAGALLLSFVTRQQAMAFILPFFFFSLLAVALARLEDVGRIKGEVGRIFDLSWLGILVVVAALTVGLAGALLIWLARPEGLEIMRGLWAPIGNLLVEALLVLLAILLAPFEPILSWLSNLMAQAWLSMLESPLLEGLGALQPGMAEDVSSPQIDQLIAIALRLLRLLCGVGLLALLLSAGLYLLQRERQRQREIEEIHENLDVSLGDALAGLWRRARDRLRGAAHLWSQFGISGDLLAAISVRNIYVNTVRLARQRGYPRHKARTPYEYLADLRAAFPQAQSEAQAITDAYVAVHYGELPTGREEMDSLRTAFQRLKDSPPSTP